MQNPPVVREFDMEDNVLYMEVEDIMCDQGIISAELNVDFQSRSSTIALSAARLKIAISLLVRAVAPAVSDVYSAYLGKQKTVVESVRHQLLPTILAFIANSVSRSLASVQRGITFPLSLRIIKQENTEPLAVEDDDVPERSVNCCVLSEPNSSEDIVADIIFIHGLHGGLDRTWKQGDWRRTRQKFKLDLQEAIAAAENEIVSSKRASLKRSVSNVCSNLPSKMAKMNNNEYVCHEDHQKEEKDKGNEDDEELSDCWPKDWLSKDCSEARVIAVNYTTDILWRPLWIKKRNRTNLIERSWEMIEELLKLEIGTRPIIWVAHSKGGLYVKQILINAWENSSNKQELEKIYSSTKGIMFYSVPHKGSMLADYNLPLLRKSVELTEVRRNCEFVLNLHEKFLQLCEHSSFKPEIVSIIETAFTLMSFLYVKIVAYESADPDIGIKYGFPVDHREICKPAGRDCFLYVQLLELIKRVVPIDT